MRTLIMILAVSLAGCTDGSDGKGPSSKVDQDQDGWNAVEDCDDTNGSIHPGAGEICDGIDNDCDDEVDEYASDAIVYYLDQDDDGFGNANLYNKACEMPEGYVLNDEDCDDELDTVYPDAPETCNDIDDDCDGDVDEDTGELYYDDDDNDGFGDPNTEKQLCDPGPLVRDNTDCNDNDSRVYPGAPEVCDGRDNNCDGEVDDDDLDNLINPTTWYYDGDSDGYGRDTNPVVQCEQIPNYVQRNGDCDDNDPTRNPGKKELCGDGIDNDCANGIDDEFSVDATSFWTDQDRDGFGDPNGLERSCDDLSATHASNNKDCDDTDPNINPSSVWYRDADNDSYGNPMQFFKSCIGVAGYVLNGDDCDDTTTTITNVGCADTGIYDTGSDWSGDSGPIRDTAPALDSGLLVDSGEGAFDDSGEGAFDDSGEGLLVDSGEGAFDDSGEGLIGDSGDPLLEDTGAPIATDSGEVSISDSGTPLDSDTGSGGDSDTALPSDTDTDGFDSDTSGLQFVDSGQVLPSDSGSLTQDSDTGAAGVFDTADDSDTDILGDSSLIIPDSGTPVGGDSGGSLLDTSLTFPDSGALILHSGSLSTDTGDTSTK